MSQPPSLLKKVAVAALGRMGVFTATAIALGQTVSEMEAIYDSPKLDQVCNGENLLGFERPGMAVIVAVKNGVAAAIVFLRAEGRFYPREIDALLAASANEGQWNQTCEAPEKWKRTDGGALAFAGSENSLVIFGRGSGAEIVAKFIESNA